MSSDTSHSKPLVLVFGATGRTGKSIIHGLLDSGEYRVAAIVRSAAHPSVEVFRKAGVQVHLLDAARATTEDLRRVLEGVEVLVSVASAFNLRIQRPLFEAAALAGVKRVVPSAFATPCPPGVMSLHDEKLEELEFIKSLGLGWTWIDVGWWLQLSLPYPTGYNGNPFVSQFDRIIGDGTTPFAVSDLNDIGRVVAHIISDPRTLNNMVLAVAEEVTQQDIWQVAQEFTSEGKDIAKKQAQVLRAEVLQTAETARAAFDANPSLETEQFRSFSEYMASIHFRGDDTVANARRMGYLIFKDLYPDFKFTSLREYAERFYRNPTDIPS